MVSLETANFWFNLSNVILLFGALLVTAGTYGVYQTGIIKERYGDERISENERTTNEAKAAASKADENTQIIKKANILLQDNLERERAARLKLESKLAPRRLSAEQEKLILKAISPSPARGLRS